MPHTFWMPDPWSPELRVAERDGVVRLSLGGIASGSGRSLQEAGNDLLARLFDLAMSLRSGRIRFGAELRPPMPQVLDYLWEVADVASGGGDLRAHVFGAPTPRLPSD